RQQVAVAREPRAERVAESRQAPPVAEQQVRRAVGAGRQYQAVAGDRAPRPLSRLRAGTVAMLAVGDLVATAVPRPQPDHLAAGADVGAAAGAPGRRGGQVGVVETVLRAVVAADGALPAQTAGAGGAGEQ